MGRVILVKIEGDGTEVKAALARLTKKPNHVLLDKEIFDAVQAWLMPIERFYYVPWKKRGLDTLVVGDRFLSRYMSFIKNFEQKKKRWWLW